jgi:hypothetical protein
LACRRATGGGDEKWAWQRETEAAENKHIRISVCMYAEKDEEEEEEEEEEPRRRPANPPRTYDY